MPDRVFVYGTLMRGFDHPMSKLLSSDADFLGEASCRGRLYMVAHYPGLLHSDEANDVVFGELFRLRNVDELMAALDDYESVGPGHPHEHQPGEEHVDDRPVDSDPYTGLRLQLSWDID